MKGKRYNEYFEPGCIQCQECGQKPDDCWDMDPEGFMQHNETDEVYCEECDLVLRKENFGD